MPFFVSTYIILVPDDLEELEIFTLQIETPVTQVTLPNTKCAMTFLTTCGAR